MKKKILHIITSIDNGGAENHLFDLVSKQVVKYEIFIVYFKGNNFYKSSLEKIGVKVFKIDYKNKNIFDLFLNFLKILKIYKVIKPNIIHCHLWISEIYGLLLKLIYKNKFSLIVTKHLDSFIFEGSSGQNKIFQGVFLEKMIFKFSNHVIFISKSVKKYFLKKIKINKKNYSIIYYGINKKKFKKINKNKIKLFKKKLKIKKNDYIIGCIARHVEQKSLQIILKSYALFKEKNLNISIKLIMIGKGYLTNELKKLAKTLNIKNNILWIKKTNYINYFYNIFDVLCLSSKYEGLGLVLIESIISGVPVLATRSGAIPELIKNKKNGYLVKYGDIKSFSNHILPAINLKKNIFFKKQHSNSLNFFSLNELFFKTDSVYRKFL